MALRSSFLLGGLCLALVPMALLAKQPVEPVGEIANQNFQLTTAAGSAAVPFVISLDWSKPQPQVTRAIIIFHGKGRNAEGSYRTAREAARNAGAAADQMIFIAPQFLDEEDADAHAVSAELLRWRRAQWESGAVATPLPISSYEIVDALLARLNDRAIFPNLKTIVLAGHSGGGQLIQRYAVVGRALKNGDIHLRFVVANPSSYLYFSDERPAPNESCKGFNHWKYGRADANAYVNNAAGSWQQREADYAQRDVIYLLGTADTDPQQKDLDVSCSAETQGPTRFARGQSYYAYLHERHASGWNQHLWFVPGVAHSAEEMFTSACGVKALFDVGSCADQ